MRGRKPWPHHSKAPDTPLRGPLQDTATSTLGRCGQQPTDPPAPTPGLNNPESDHSFLIKSTPQSIMAWPCGTVLGHPEEECVTTRICARLCLKRQSTLPSPSFTPWKMTPAERDLRVLDHGGCCPGRRPVMGRVSHSTVSVLSVSGK